ncbi:MAG: 23S rRNA (uracil(1939)-C(5))-methyltransferase RlmD [Catenisphaera adipataccumulans]|jgi:23S rRNA (uracil1939-C5)-methyltransferase|uniref:23S rRNA (uracil(1939)-C(5))-methyltransferase RlmD n=1 Tax=Catenisphaera adipataccumulans TaxID=700500 RepID=UPI003D8CF5D3
MKKNELYEVTCIDDTNLAAGVVKVEGRAVFVPKLLPGEKAEIRIVKVLKKYAFGRIEHLIQASPDRIEPLCAYAKTCGGCQLQHLRYPAQLAWKQRHIEALFPEQNVQPILAAPSFSYYRNKAQFPVQIRNRKVIMGFYRSHSNDIVPCERCMIQSEEINAIFQVLQERLTPEMAEGLRHILIRTTRTHQAQIVFIGEHKNHWKPLIRTLIRRFPAIQSIVFNRNTRRDNVILGSEYEVLYGSDSVIDQCLGNQVKLHFKSFYQVNPEQMDVLYQTAIRMAKLEPTMDVAELYAGTGTIGMAVSSHVHHVTGVEIVPEAVENARQNCSLNHIENCTYVCEDASVFAKRMAAKKKRVDAVFVDPPRKGMTAQGIRDIVTLQPEQIVYISCNPQTLARDIKLYEQEGYECKVIQPVDMFPMTLHVETVVLMSRVRD